MAGLIGTGLAYKDMARRGLAEVAREEQERKQTNQQIKGAERAQTASNIGLGATLGASIGAGTAVGGPWGAAIGALVGLAGSLL